MLGSDRFPIQCLVFCVMASMLTDRANGQFRFGEPVNLGEPINSSAHELTSEISDDGLTLLFARTDLFVGEANSDLWLATRTSPAGKWSEPKPLGPAVNSPAFEASPSLSSDGLELYFADDFADLGFSRRPGGLGKGDIWVTTRARINDDFGVPRNLGSVINSTSDDAAPDISSDGRTLFFHSRRGDGLSAKIYVSTRTDISDPLGWGPPVKLGSAVNSDFAAAPNLSHDGLTMFFASNRPGGFGAVDIWMTSRSDASDPMGWGRPENLGPNVNSSAPDYGPDISADSTTFRFSTERPGSSATDIWEVPVTVELGESVLAYDNATIQRDGPRQDEFGRSLLVVEGQASGDAASYGVFRFDVSNIKGQFDTRFGPGGWSVETLDLVLTQADPFFNAFEGQLEIFFSSNDDVDISQQASSLTYPLGSGFPDAESILTYPFVPLVDGQRETYTLYDATRANTAGGLSLISDISTNTTITLALAESDRGVAAYYAGIANPDFDGPTLRITASKSAVELQAGDADQDLDFDQLDLVRVQIAAKYLTGQPATWGEGDWNGAPGGSPGSPPTGDGLFNQLDVVAAQVAGLYLAGPYSAVQPAGREADGQTSVGYDANTGELWIDAPAGIELTSVHIDSATGIFTGNPAENLGGSFDNDADNNNIFKATFGSSFGSLAFGRVAERGLSETFLLSDLTVVGSLAGAGDLGEVDLIYVAVPEPTTIAFMVAGLVGMVWWQRWMHCSVLEHRIPNNE